MALATHTKILTFQGKGYLTRFDLNYFFRAIQSAMVKHGQEAVEFGDVSDEIFDMCRPRDPYQITLDDLIESGQEIEIEIFSIV